MHELSRHARIHAAIVAPTGPGLRFPDTQVVSRAGFWQIITPSAPGSMMNEVVLSDLAAEDADAFIDETIALYRGYGKAVKWSVGPWTRPADFGERLARRGFRSWDVRGMGRTTDMPMPDVDRIGRAGVSLVEVETDVPRYLRAQEAGWGSPPSSYDVLVPVFATAFAASPRVVHLFGALVDDAYVGTAALFLREGYAYLLGTEVHEAFRGRGLYRALVAQRMQFLRARGIGYAVTQAREATSAPILERLGFETLFRSTCWVLDAPP